MSQTFDSVVAPAAPPAAAATFPANFADAVDTVSPADGIVDDLAALSVSDFSSVRSVSDVSDDESLSLLSVGDDESAADSGGDDGMVAAPAAPASRLRFTAPWVAGEIYGVIPLAPLTLVPDNGEKWYAITKGRYIGCTNSVAIADNAVTCVSHALRTGYGTQAQAVDAFNAALADVSLGLVRVLSVN